MPDTKKAPVRDGRLGSGGHTRRVGKNEADATGAGGVLNETLTAGRRAAFVAAALLRARTTVAAPAATATTAATAFTTAAIFARSLAGIAGAFTAGAAFTRIEPAAMARPVLPAAGAATLGIVRPLARSAGGRCRSGSGRAPEEALQPSEESGWLRRLRGWSRRRRLVFARWTVATF